MLTIEAFTIYHSPNAYLGTVLLRRALGELPEVRLVRRPIFIPRTRGVMVADLIGSHEPAVKSAYNREDCARWAARHAIPFVHTPPEVFTARRQRWAEARWEREELPARAFYAAVGSGREDVLDAKLFEVAFIAGLDVNEPATIASAAAAAGLDPDRLLHDLEDDAVGAQAAQALADFERVGCPGVPTCVFEGQRFFGKDRVDWVIDAVRARIAAQ